MATETQYPDAILASTNLSGAVTDIDDDVDSPDANWMIAIANDVNTDVRCSYPTPTGPPTVGAGLQSFRVWVRKNRNKTGTPTCQIELWENGGLVRAGSASNVTSDTGEEKSFTWNANELATSDGSLVEIKVVGVYGGTAPNNYVSLDVGAVNWDVDYTPATVYAYPGPATATSAAVNPVVAMGEITVSPVSAAAASAAVDPTVVLGELQVVPGAAFASVSAVSPATVLGGVTRAPPPALATSAAPDPTAFITGQIAIPDPAVATSAAVDPSVQLVYTATPDPALATSAAVDPIATSNQLAFPDPALATSSASDPGTLFGELIAAPDPAAATTAAPNPTVLAGEIQVSPGPAVAASAAISPSTSLSTLAWYNKGKESVLNGDCDLLTSSIRVLLVGTGYSFNPDHNVVNDVVGQELGGSGYSRKVLAGKSVNIDLANDRSYFDANDVEWTSITVSKVGAVILFQFVTDDSDSRLIACQTYGDGPTPSGGTLGLAWNGNGILEIG